MIMDSGDRRAFDTGAVRDMQEGKGRCDLLPIQVVARLYIHDWVLRHLAAFVEDNNTDHLYDALRQFASDTYKGKETMLLETAKHFEEGAAKYGENNWQKGIPVWCYLDSAIRHYLKHKRGDTDERHDRAFCWNILCCIWEVDYHNAQN